VGFGNADEDEESMQKIRSCGRGLLYSAKVLIVLTYSSTPRPFGWVVSTGYDDIQLLIEVLEVK
jgi:hypothetical protein